MRAAATPMSTSTLPPTAGAASAGSSLTQSTNVDTASEATVGGAGQARSTDKSSSAGSQEQELYTLAKVNRRKAREARCPLGNRRARGPV